MSVDPPIMATQNSMLKLCFQTPRVAIGSHKNRPSRTDFFNARDSGRTCAHCGRLLSHRGRREIDLLLEIPGNGLWAIEITRSLAGRPEKGFYIACQDLKPDRRFVVNAGSGYYPIDAEITAIGLHELAAMLAALAI
jgi:hypothetical protein